MSSIFQKEFCDLIMDYKKIIMDNKMFFEDNKIQRYFSPGRVNLIGEHIDYNGGNVLPTAIDMGTYGFVSKRSDKEFHFRTHNELKTDTKIINVSNLEFSEKRSWANYCSGMLNGFIEAGYNINTGLNILVYGNLPTGSGLSSSASLEVLIGIILKEEFNFDISMLEIVKMGQNIENYYIGVNCGIMDQFAVGMSKKNMAIYLNTESLEYELVPMILGDYSLVITNTKKKRKLSESKYNERRTECDKGINILKDNGIMFDSICDLKTSEFNDVEHFLNDQDIRNRLKHAVYENKRTKDAVKALKNKDFIKFGQLMNESHDSLRDLYEVSCYELDTLVNSFRKHGAIGSRMTGAGFGGCTITLVKTSDLDSILSKVKSDYLSLIGYNAGFYPVKSSDGAKKLKDEVKL